MSDMGHSNKGAFHKGAVTESRQAFMQEGKTSNDITSRTKKQVIPRDNLCKLSLATLGNDICIY